MVTNNITRFLDSRKIKYAAFELPPQKLGAEETAAYLGIELAKVFKSIVVLREKTGKPILAIVPGNEEVDLKLLAAAIGEKKLRIATQTEAEKFTGLQTGGISPLALINKGFQFVLSVKAQQYSEIHISGGQRGLNIKLPVDELISLVRARVAYISK